MPPVVLAPPKVLILRLRGVSEVLLATPLVRALRARHPQAHLALLTTGRLGQLVAENPNIDELITLTPDASLRDLAPALRSRGFSHVVDLEDSLRTRALRALVPAEWSTVDDAGLARWLLGRARRGQGDGSSLAERYLGAARTLDVEPDDGPVELHLSETVRERAARWLERTGLGQQRPVVAFAPGSVHRTRRWPVEYWAELVRRIVRTGADAVVVGSTDESPTASEVALRGGPRAASAAGELHLLETAALIARAEALIVGDTGLLHVASGVGTPVVALFGPTVRTAGTFPFRAHGAVIERELPCRPCSASGEDECPMKHHLCLRAIRTSDVFDVLSRTLAPRRVDATTPDPTPPPVTPEDRAQSGWSLF